MLRTSLYLPNPLHQRLYLASKQENKSISRLVKELLNYALAKKEKTHIQKMYAGLSKLWGSGPRGLTDVSTTIDETLYGENGAWRGQHG